MKRALIVIAVVVGIFLIFKVGVLAYDRWRWGPKPSETTASTFVLNLTGYECSKPIEGEWVRGSIGVGYYFRPSNHDDVKKYWVNSTPKCTTRENT